MHSAGVQRWKRQEARQTSTMKTTTHRPILFLAEDTYQIGNAVLAAHRVNLLGLVKRQSRTAKSQLRGATPSHQER